MIKSQKVKNGRTGFTRWYTEYTPKGWKFSPIVGSGETKEVSEVMAKKRYINMV